MLKKMLRAAVVCATVVMLLRAFSGTQTVVCDAACVAEMKAEAERGNAVAQGALGDCYGYALRICEGIPQDYPTARKWWEKAAAQGNAPAQFNLGRVYYNGRGVRQDYAIAREWYEKAAAQGHAPSQFNLGTMYYHGKGVRQNKRTAKKWFSKACDNGLQQSCDAYRKLSYLIFPFF